MKMPKRIISTILSGVMAAAICASATLTVSAAGVYYEPESQYEPGSPGTDINFNGSFEKAAYFPVSSLLKKTYSYLQGNFRSDLSKGYIDEADYYRFTTGQTEGNSGRFAIKLEGIPAGHDYDLFLFDSNKNLIDESTRSGNKNEIVRTPAIKNNGTSYYLLVKPVNVPDSDVSNYRIVVDEYIATVTQTVSLSPTSLSAKPDVWSADAYKDMRNLPEDAVIVDAKVSAKKNTSVENAYNNMLRVKIGNGEYIPVTWASGDINVPQLVGTKCSAYWYVGFKASELPIFVGGKLTTIGSVSMNTFKLTIKYEYDKLASY